MFAKRRYQLPHLPPDSDDAVVNVSVVWHLLRLAAFQPRDDSSNPFPPGNRVAKAQVCTSSCVVEDAVELEVIRYAGRAPWNKPDQHIGWHVHERRQRRA